MTFLARWRVPLGFVSGLVAILLAKPSWPSWIAGACIATSGEFLRLWAAGHIEKGREITRSGPYRFVRHPLYLGSTLMAVGFALASHSIVVAALSFAYVSTTIVAAIRTEEAHLDRAFEGAYSKYREGQGGAMERAFSWKRAAANHEYQAVMGLAAVFAILACRL